MKNMALHSSYLRVKGSDASVVLVGGQLIQPFAVRTCD